MASCSRTSRRSWNGNCSFPGPDGYLRPLPVYEPGAQSGFPPQTRTARSESWPPRRSIALSCFAGAAEKPLPHKARDSFPSWTSPVRPRSPALVKSRRLRRPTSIRLMYWPALKVKAPGLRTGRPACARPLDPVQELYEGGPHGGAPLSHGAPISLSGRANQPVASRRATPTGATPVTIRPGCS